MVSSGTSLGLGPAAGWPWAGVQWRSDRTSAIRLSRPVTLPRKPLAKNPPAANSSAKSAAAHAPSSSEYFSLSCRSSATSWEVSAAAPAWGPPAHRLTVRTAQAAATAAARVRRRMVPGVLMLPSSSDVDAESRHYCGFAQRHQRTRKGEAADVRAVAVEAPPEFGGNGPSPGGVKSGGYGA